MAVEPMCAISGKRQLTREAAEFVARRTRRNHDGERVSAYHCRCNWWHVGTTPVAKPKKNAR